MTSESQRFGATRSARAPVAVLVVEAEPVWVPELQRQFLTEAVEVRSCDRLSRLADRWLSVRPTAVVWVLDRTPLEGLRAFAPWTAQRPNVPLLVLREPEFAEWEDLAREVGATSVQTLPIAGTEVATLLRRWIAAAVRSELAAVTSDPCVASG